MMSKKSGNSSDIAFRDLVGRLAQDESTRPYFPTSKRPRGNNSGQRRNRAGSGAATDGKNRLSRNLTGWNYTHLTLPSTELLFGWKRAECMDRAAQLRDAEVKGAASELLPIKGVRIIAKLNVSLSAKKILKKSDPFCAHLSRY
jgi:hypothetical protein